MKTQRSPITPSLNGPEITGSKVPSSADYSGPYGPQITKSQAEEKTDDYPGVYTPEITNLILLIYIHFPNNKLIESIPPTTLNRVEVKQKKEHVMLEKLVKWIWSIYSCISRQLVNDTNAIGDSM